MSAWPSNTPSVPPLTEAQQTERRNAAIRAWLDNRKNLAFYKEHEMDTRVNVTQLLFPNPKKGTQRFDVGAGYAVKLVHKINYDLGRPDTTNAEGAPVSKTEQVEAMLDKIDALGPVAEKLGSRLVKWSAELSVSEYTKLDLSDPVEKQIKALIDEILVVKDAAPTLEWEEPKPSPQ